MSHPWRLEATCRSSQQSEGGAVVPELPDSPTLLRHRIIMHIALHPDVTDLTVSQTAACGEIIIYSVDYCEENTV